MVKFRFVVPIINKGGRHTSTTEEDREGDINLHASLENFVQIFTLSI